VIIFLTFYCKKIILGYLIAKTCHLLVKYKIVVIADGMVSLLIVLMNAMCFAGRYSRLLMKTD
jgi:hypothetical protein